MATLIDVLDTAVKIGLGAAISGIAAYWHTKQKDRSDSAKEYEKRHRALLEQVAEQLEEANHAFLKYWAFVVEWVRYEKSGNEWPRRKELDEVKSEVFRAFKSLTSGEAKLLLLNEKDAHEELRRFGEAVVSFRRTCYVDKEGLTEEEMNTKKEDIRKIRESLFSYLSESYQQTFT